MGLDQVVKPFTSYCYLFHQENLEKKNPLKGSQLGAFCSQAMVYCYPKFKLRYLKNLKLFSIRIKELFEPIVLREKKGFSWETDLWITLGDFTEKNKTKQNKHAKLDREICIELIIDQVETKCGVLQISTIICVTYRRLNARVS